MSRAARGGGKQAQSFNVLRERLEFAFVSLVGKKVHVTLKSGVVFEGLFYAVNTAASNEAELGVVLKMARKVKDPTTKGRDRRIIRSLIVHSQDFVEIEARNVPAVVGGSGLLGGFTDTEISGANVKAGQHRELTKWVDDGAGGPELSLGSSSDRGWDQFAENEKLFNVKSTYNERLYTTELNKAKLTPEQRAQAERLAKEIESDTSGNSNIHIREERGQETQADKELDEEDKHSSVLTSTGGQRHLQAPASTSEPAATKRGTGKPFKLNPSARSWTPNPEATAFVPGQSVHNSQSFQPSAMGAMGVPMPMPGQPHHVVTMPQSNFANFHRPPGLQPGMPIMGRPPMIRPGFFPPGGFNPGFPPQFQNPNFGAPQMAAPQGANPSQSDGSS